MAFVKQDCKTLGVNPFTTIGDEWFLLTAGTPDSYNTMTASWGAMGVIWGNLSVTAYVRTSRHTMPYMEQNALFSICVFDESWRKALQFCGTHSGRDYDKAKETGLIPVELDGTTVFEQAKLVFICEKAYDQMMDEAGFVDHAEYEKWYSKDEMHKMYIGRIKAVYVNE